MPASEKKRRLLVHEENEAHGALQTLPRSVRVPESLVRAQQVWHGFLETRKCWHSRLIAPRRPIGSIDMQAELWGALLAKP